MVPGRRCAHLLENDVNLYNGCQDEGVSQLCTLIMHLIQLEDCFHPLLISAARLGGAPRSHQLVSTVFLHPLPISAARLGGAPRSHQLVITVFPTRTTAGYSLAQIPLTLAQALRVLGFSGHVQQGLLKLSNPGQEGRTKAESRQVKRKRLPVSRPLTHSGILSLPAQRSLVAHALLTCACNRRRLRTWWTGQ